MYKISHPLWRGLASAAVGVALFWQAACATVSPSSILNAQLESKLPELNFDVVVIQVINQTDSTVSLDLLVDGLPQTINCSPLVGICRLPLPECPQEIKAIQERLLDPQGRFTGGLDFNDSDDFTFTTGEFECGSVIVFRFGDREAQAFVL